MVDAIIDSIRTWLKEENIQYNIREDNESDYHLQFWISRGLQLDVVVKGDKLMVSASIQFSNASVNIFRTESSRFHKLDLELHQQIPRFTFLYADINNTQLVGVKIFKDIWAESLTKTSFFDAPPAVEHSYYIVAVNERELTTLNR